MTAIVIAMGIALLPLAHAAEPDLDEVWSTLNQTKDLYEAGKFTEAHEAAERHIAAVEKAFGQGASETATGYVYQAMCHASTGETAKARKARDTALTILSTTPSHDPNFQATTLFGLAVVSRSLKDIDVAIKCAAEATDLWRQHAQDVRKTLGPLLHHFAELSSDKGENELAGQMYERALWAITKAYGDSSKERLKCLVDLATHYGIQGREREALVLHEAAAEIVEQLLGADSPLMAQAMLRIAACRELLGEYAEAELLARKVCTDFGSTHEQGSVEMARAIAIIARSCARQGKWEQAETSAREAIRIVRNADGGEPLDVTDAYLSLMLVYESQKRYEDAEKTIRESLALANTHDDAQKAQVMPRLAALAFILWSAGKHGDADAVFSEAVAACERDFGVGSVPAAFMRANHAANYFYQGQYTEAEELLEQSLNALRQVMGDDHFQVAMLSVNLATVQAAQGKWKLAAEQNDEGIQGTVRHIRSQLSSLSPVEQLRVLRGEYAIGYQAALTMGLMQRTDPHIRKLSAAWLTNGKAIAHEASAWQAAQARLNVSAVLSKKRFGDDGASHPWVDIETIRERLPRNAVLIDIARFDVFNYAAKRKGEDWLPARYAAWIVPPMGTGSIELVDLGDAKAVDLAVSEYRAVIRAALGKKGLIAEVGEAEAESALREAAKPLTERILKPILAGVEAAGCAETAREFIVSPDGELWLVPWAAIPMADSRYLVEKYALSTVTSGRDLVRSRGAELAPSAPVIFADPVFDLSIESLTKAIEGLNTEQQAAVAPDIHSVATSTALSRSVAELDHVARLPGTPIEALMVAEQIQVLTNEKPVIFLQKRAIEERVKRVQSPRILHFATHGFALPDQVVSAARVERMSAMNAGGRPIQGLTSESGEPLEDPLLRCGLLLTGCNTPAAERPEGIEDGCLTGKEILSLDLSSTEIVVLSACDTGLGRVQYGEGVAGLRQAFLIAGAESVLATLWQVPDAPTVDLMTGFFKQLAASRGKASALRQAQLSMIENRRKATGAAHPAAWAALEITGR